MGAQTGNFLVSPFFCLPFFIPTLCFPLFPSLLTSILFFLPSLLPCFPSSLPPVLLMPSVTTPSANTVHMFAAYQTTYGSDPVWMRYRRNFKGAFPPSKTRKTCIVSVGLFLIFFCAKTAYSQCCVKLRKRINIIASKLHISFYILT